MHVKAIKYLSDIFLAKTPNPSILVVIMKIFTLNLTESLGFELFVSGLSYVPMTSFYAVMLRYRLLVLNGFISKFHSIYLIFSSVPLVSVLAHKILLISVSHTFSFGTRLLSLKGLEEVISCLKKK